MLAIRIDSTSSTSDVYIRSGKVGIGTTNVGIQTKLQVYEAGTEQAWKGRGVFGNETCAFVCGVYHNKVHLGGHNGALNAWYDIAINPNGGNVGIGTNSPANKLEIHGGPLGLKNGNHTATTAQQILFGFSGVANLEYAHSIRTRHNGQSSANDTQNSIDFYLWKKGDTTTTIGEKHGMSITAAGVGIGTTNPVCSLQVASSTNITGFPARGFLGSNGAGNTGAWGGTAAVSIKASAYIWGETAIIASSDRRIKENIVDVSDNQALEMLRNIPCRYYEYKDKIGRGYDKTIGFIAQEVREVMPMATNLQKDIIPNEMRNLTDISWNDATLYTDLSDCSGVKYRFYVSNDLCGNEIMKEVVGNSDNSFTFDTSYNNVFCYGKEVDDFHTLDKQKLFALNFSATQELDRQQQADKAKIATLETENQELKTKVANLESKLQSIEQRLAFAGF